jgi:hypothetical protein
MRLCVDISKLSEFGDSICYSSMAIGSFCGCSRALYWIDWLCGLLWSKMGVVCWSNSKGFSRLGAVMDRLYPTL